VPSVGDRNRTKRGVRAKKMRQQEENVMGEGNRVNRLQLAKNL